MKKSNRFYLAAGLAALMNMNIAQAVPLYYTFDGRADVNGANSQAEAVYNELTGVSLGDTVSYVFLVDDEVSGNDQEYGYSVESSGTSDTLRFSYYTELVFGSGLIPDGNGSGDPDSGSAFEGVLSYSASPSSPYYTTPGWTYTHFFGRGFNGTVDIVLAPYIPRSESGSYEDISQWLADASISTHDSRLGLSDDEGNHYSFSHDLVLTSVSSASPTTSVPEPATYLLMGLGFVGMGMSGFKKRLS